MSTDSNLPNDPENEAANGDGFTETFIDLPIEDEVLKGAQHLHLGQIPPGWQIALCNADLETQAKSRRGNDHGNRGKTGYIRHGRFL